MLIIISIQGGNRMRSIRSWIIERLLKRLSNKDSFTDEKRYAKFLKQRQNENEKPNILTKYIKQKNNIKKKKHQLKQLNNKDSFTDEKRYAKFLKQKKNENEKPYILPKYIQKKYNIKKQYFKGMECYTFNYENHSSNKSILYLHGGG